MASPNPTNHHSFVVRYGQWLIRWRWPVVIFSVLVTLGIASGARFLAFNTDYRAFFSKDNPQLNAFEAMEAIYTKNENVFMTLEAKDGHVFTRDFLQTTEELTAESWKIPYTIRVDSITNFQHTWAAGDDLVVEDLITNAKDLTDEELDAAQQIALAEPLLLNRLISPQGHVTAINATLQIPEGDQEAALKIAKHVRELATRFEAADPNLRVHLTGVAFLNNAFQEAGIADMMTLVPIMYLVIFLFILLMLRSIPATIASVMVITMSVLVGMAMAGWVGIQLTPPSASAPTMIMTLAVADSIHLLSSMLALMRRGMAKAEAIVESLRMNAMPIFLTSATTCIGFLTMNMSDAPPFRDLGNIVTMGIVGAYVTSIFFMPAFAMILPLRAKPGLQTKGLNFDWFTNFILARRTWLLWGVSALVLVLAALIPLNELNDDFVGYFDKKVAFRQDSEFTSDNVSGIYFIEHSIEVGESGGISNPEYLQKLEEFAEWYREQPHVKHVNSFSLIMKRLNKNMHGDDPAWYRTPDTRDLAAQYLLLYEFSLPYGLDLNNQINVDKSSTRFTVSMENVSAKILRDTAERGERWLREHAPPSMFTHAVGTALMFAYISERNIKSMLLASFLAFVLIGVSLMFVFRSVKFGLFSLIPNMIPAVMGFGLWAIIVGRINMALAIVTAMTLGIVVDDTIHFLTKYLRARREQHLSPEHAVRYTFSAVGPALLSTTVVLIAGFYVLTRSTFAMNSDMGLLTAITIGFALLADFLLLPPLLMRVDAERAPVPAPTPTSIGVPHEAPALS